MGTLLKGGKKRVRYRDSLICTRESLYRTLFLLSLLLISRLSQAQIEPTSQKSIDYFGISVEVGAASVDVAPLNRYFTSVTSGQISPDASVARLALILGNQRGLYGSFYYAKLATDYTLNPITPSFLLKTSTFGFEFNNTLVNRRIRFILPSLGIGYHFNTLAYDAGGTSTLPLTTLFQQPTSFAVTSNNIAASVGSGIYYNTHLIRKQGAKELYIGFTGNYFYSFATSNWQLEGGSRAVQVPPQKLNQYSVRLSIGVLVDR